MTNIDLKSLSISLGILGVSVVVSRWVVPYFFRFLIRSFRDSKTSMLSDVGEAFEKPVRALIMIIGLYFSIKTAHSETASYGWVNSAFRSSYVFLLAWGLMRLTSISSHWIEGIGKKLNFEVDRILLPFLSKILRAVILCLCFTVIVQEWGYEVTGFIAGLGLGGLAFALAAKDAISNIFGGIVIITEKPFTLDDWIETPSVEGTVESITFRSTRIRTFAQALVTMPNSTLANEPITNWSRMGKRRITFHLGLTYSTSTEKITACLDAIRGMLVNREDIDQETIFVHLDRFGPSSQDIFLYFFTKTTQWSEWLQTKESCMIGILEILEREGVSIAKPSTSVYFETASSDQVKNRSSLEATQAD
ncbi:mechanosensitive ion channel family protein [Cohnella luojiensis]|uniref:Mechanosensitive ion channel family protein n=1 Tax=Cohnella luojiensis TaxID=652876 RepID=A0A4Y8LQ81_9BACL|nr:mechanosensitive ion channel family protein [Cohnella luojiensis]TFE23453.1 mechanosensitive ion channel family protein [Cohnella luojiensis]